MAIQRDNLVIAYSTLDAALRAGQYRPGDRIVVGDVAASLRLSATPVREALCRLAGEGRIEDRRHEGYWAPRPRPRTLRQRYEAAAVVTLALAGLAAGAPFEAVPRPELMETDPATLTSVLFAALLRRAGHEAFIESWQRIDGQLAPYRHAEALTIPNFAGDLLALAALCAGGEPSALRAALRRYHSIRARSADLLCDVAERRAPGRP